MIMGGGGLLILTVKVAEFVAGVGALSVTVTVNVDMPAALGVPPTEPVLTRLRPSGSAPEVIAQLSGRNPPVAENWYP